MVQKQLMSHLIEILCPSQQSDTSQKPPKHQITYHNLHQYLKKFTSLSDSIKYFQHSNEKCRILLQLKLYNSLPTVILKIEIDMRKCEYKSKFTFKSGGLLWNCQTKCLRIMIIRELQILRKRMKFHSFVFNVGHQSGEMVAKCVFSIAPHANLYQILINELVPLRSHFNRFLSIVMFRTNQLPPFFPQLIHQRTKRAQQVNIQDRIEKRIYKYYIFSIIQLCRSLSQSPSAHIQDPVDKQLTKRLQDEQFVGFEEGNSELYFHKPKSKFEIQNKFSTSEQESDNIRTHIAFPKTRSESNIFNEIKVIQDGNEVINTGFRGGTNRIMIIKLKFMYMNSLTNPGINHNNKPLATKQYSKFMAIKFPIEPLRQGKQKSSQHEINILKLFSDVESPFLLRYFVDNSNSFKYKNMLMMSFMSNCDTLSTFLSKRNQVLSFNSKLYILINLLQGLRFIKQYNVVHMDVSPGNILVNPNHMTQLIDFGQSYHPSVCDKDENYRPGYTLPFSFPEKFRQHQFTPKSDIFSFAIVVFFCFFKGYPYHPSSRLAHSLKNLTYLSKFYFAPESGEYFGYRKIIAFLFSYIQKCMDKDLVVRPHPSQSIILFKQMYYWLYEISMNI